MRCTGRGWARIRRICSRDSNFAGASALTGNVKRANELYLQVLAIDPNQVGALNELALLASGAKDPHAQEYAERAYALQPASGSIGDTLGWILVGNGDLERGVKVLEKAVDAAPANTEARYHLALALLKTGNKPAARSNLRQIAAGDRWIRVSRGVDQAPPRALTVAVSVGEHVAP